MGRYCNGPPEGAQYTIRFSGEFAGDHAAEFLYIIKIMSICDTLRVSLP